MDRLSCPAPRHGTGGWLAVSLPRDDFLHEVWFFRTWFSWSDERIAARLGITWESFVRRMKRAEAVGKHADTTVDRWVDLELAARQVEVTVEALERAGQRERAS